MSHTETPPGTGDTDGSGRRLPLIIPDTIRGYTDMTAEKRASRNEFWEACASELLWDKPFTIVVEEDFNTPQVSWFSDGSLNAGVNALDYQLASGNGDRPALIVLDTDGGITTHTYAALYERTMSIANALHHRGIVTGDRVALYLPDCADAVQIILACARLGIIIVPIPPRFTAEVTVDIITDCGASLLAVSLNTDPTSYGDRARTVMERVKNIPIINTGNESAGSVISLASFIEAGSDTEAPTVSVPAEHPLLIIYANSAAGIPRGSVFATGGFLVQAFATADAIYAANTETCADSVFCTVGLTSAAGQSYGLWGTLLSGRTLVLPDCTVPVTKALLGTVVDNTAAPAFLTTPLIISTLRQEMNGNELPAGTKFRLVACTGDILLPRLVNFAASALTSAPDRVVNLWIQSETGSALIMTYPSTDLNRPGALGLAFPGIEPLVLNNFGEPCRVNESGQLVILSSWPSMIRTIWGQPERYREFYFLRNPGNFTTNDAVRVDTDGFYWFMGRLDDVIKLRGQSMATSEIEAVLVSHPSVLEAAVISAPSGEPESIFAFVVSAESQIDSESAGGTLEQELRRLLVRRIGEFAVPSQFIFTAELPRTRTGKIVRRILRRVVTGDITVDEDMSHVANPQAVEEIIRKKGS